MRIVVLLAARNEERTLDTCLRHYSDQGIDCYVIDDGSSDRTPEIIDRHLGRGLIGAERRPHRVRFDWRDLLERKERLAGSLDADWFIHADPDEIRSSPRPGETLRAALERIDREGYTAADFAEFTFVPVVESPAHDHPRYPETMLWYYPFAPPGHRKITAWKRVTGSVSLAWSGGHEVYFPGISIHPEKLVLRHYLFQSLAHARAKYARRFSSLNGDGHGWRRSFDGEAAALPPAARLRVRRDDATLDARQPWQRHWSSRPATAAVASRPVARAAGTRAAGKGALVVLGMHRSGTSAVTRLLERLGCYVGEPHETLAADFANPVGYFERRDVVDLDRDLLRVLGCWWYDPLRFDPANLNREERGRFAGRVRTVLARLAERGEPWAIKDPVLCLTLPFWRDHMPAPPVCVMTLRDPREVAASLAARDGFPHAFGLALWEHYQRAALRHSHGLPQVFVRYSDLLVRSAEETRRLGAALEDHGVGGLQALEPAELGLVLDTRLQRAREVSEITLSPAQAALWQALLDHPERVSGELLAEGLPTPTPWLGFVAPMLRRSERDQEAPALAVEFRRLQAAYRALEEGYPSLERAYRERERELAALRTELRGQAELLCRAARGQTYSSQLANGGRRLVERAISELEGLLAGRRYRAGAGLATALGRGADGRRGLAERWLAEARAWLVAPPTDGAP